MADASAQAQVKHVAIVGGGAAGWLTAATLARAHCASEPQGLAVTLIESPNVAIIGVGEGTWPTMRESLSRIGLEERALFAECDASFKQGTRFDGWRDGGASGPEGRTLGSSVQPSPIMGSSRGLRW